jgi:hypothetical protein
MAGPMVMVMERMIMRESAWAVDSAPRSCTAGANGPARSPTRSPRSAASCGCRPLPEVSEIALIPDRASWSYDRSSFLIRGAGSEV